MRDLVICKEMMKTLVDDIDDGQIHSVDTVRAVIQNCLYDLNGMD